MHFIGLDFDNDTLELNWGNQTGTESFPQLAEKRDEVLSVLVSKDSIPSKATLDFEKEELSLTFSLPGMEEKSDAILKLLGYGPIDLSNSIKLIEMLLNGQIPEGVFEKAIELESMQDEKNPIVSDFLGMLGPDNPIKL